MGTNGDVIGVWLDAMKSGLQLWYEFTAHGRIKTKDEVRRIECVYSMDIQSEIGRIREAVRLMGDSDEIGFEKEWSEAMAPPIRKVKMVERIDKLLELQKNMRFYEPDLNAYFCGFEDNDNEVNALNLALMDLFTMMSVSLTNVVCWVDGMQGGMSIDNKKGKKLKAEFRNIIQYSNKEKLVKRLHELIDGKGGADVGAVLLNAYYINPYLTRRPTQAEFESEFKLIGSWQAISNYMDENSEKALAKANRIVIF